MNNQEAFDKMVAHLFTQKKKAFIPGQGCMYRMNDGSMCAVGALIPDDEYSADFESRKAATIARLIPALRGVSLGLLSSLQNIHDNRDISAWFSRLEIACAHYELDDTVLMTFEGVELSEQP